MSGKPRVLSSENPPVVIMSEKASEMIVDATLEISFLHHSEICQVPSQVLSQSFPHEGFQPLETDLFHGFASELVACITLVFARPPKPPWRTA